MAENGTPGSLNPTQAVAEINQRLNQFARGFEVNRRILVVDDEQLVLDMLSKYFTSIDLPVDVAATAEEALERMTTAAYAVVLADKNMPGMDGIELLQTIKKKWPLTEVLIITGYGSFQTAVEAIGHGAFDYVLKPFPDFGFVGGKVRVALARHEFESSFQAMLGFLAQNLVKERGPDQKDDPFKSLQALLEDYKQEKQGHVVLRGASYLAGIIEREGYRATKVESLNEAVKLIGKQAVHVVVYAEQNGQPDGATAILKLHETRPDIGVLIIARDQDLQRVVDAIGMGVGDYVLRDMEDRTLFVARLKRLVTRQQQIERYYFLLDSLKQMNLEVMVGGKLTH